jgi:uncharacterized protein
MALVDSLLNLFHVDAQVRALRSRLNSAERYLAAQTKQHNDLLHAQQELQTRKRQFQASIGNMEIEVKTIDERVEKLRTELNSAVTNKQYSALLTEVNTIKVGRASLEERMLTDMEQVEKIQEQMQQLESQIAERARVRDLAQAQLDERKADIGQRLSELESERQKAAAVIPPATLAVFDDVADRHEGEAMSPVVEVDRRHREYACGACNMHVPFEQVSLLTSRADSLIHCPSCFRILYMQEEMRGSLAKK